MAKSLRSKWRRKMKAIKREKYAVKELKQLKKIVEQIDQKDSSMTDTCNVLTKEDLLQRNQQHSNKEVSEGMELDKKGGVYHPRKLINEFGNYPVWMNQRAIRKHKTRLHIKKGKKISRKK